MKVLKWSSTIIMCLCLIYFLWLTAIEVGDMPDSAYCTTRKTEWSMFSVWLTIVGMVAMGWFAGFETAKNKFKL